MDPAEFREHLAELITKRRDRIQELEARADQLLVAAIEALESVDAPSQPRRSDVEAAEFIASTEALVRRMEALELEYRSKAAAEREQLADIAQEGTLLGRAMEIVDQIIPIVAEAEAAGHDVTANPTFRTLEHSRVILQEELEVLRRLRPRDPPS